MTYVFAADSAFVEKRPRATVLAINVASGFELTVIVVESPEAVTVDPIKLISLIVVPIDTPSSLIVRAEPPPPPPPPALPASHLPLEVL